MNSTERIKLLQEAFERECDGLALDDWQAKAILEYIDDEPLAQPTAPADVLEQAAKVCEEYATWGGSNFREWFMKCAGSIRALSRRDHSAARGATCPASHGDSDA